MHRNPWRCSDLCTSLVSGPFVYQWSWGPVPFEVNAVEVREINDYQSQSFSDHGEGYQTRESR